MEARMLIPLPPMAAALVDALELHAELPQHIRRRAVLPCSALAAREPSLSASRLRGFDGAGQLCLYQHAYTLAAVDFDADDSPYVRVALRETLTAVRTEAGTWLQRVERVCPESSRPREDTGYRLAPGFVEP
jgi:hypothetical protein